MVTLPDSIAVLNAASKIVMECADACPLVTVLAIGAGFPHPQSQSFVTGLLKDKKEGRSYRLRPPFKTGKLTDRGQTERRVTASRIIDVQSIRSAPRYHLDLALSDVSHRALRDPLQSRSGGSDHQRTQVAFTTFSTIPKWMLNSAASRRYNPPGRF